jgi:hypothetical protein
MEVGKKLDEHPKDKHNFKENEETDLHCLVICMIAERRPPHVEVTAHDTADDV